MRVKSGPLKGLEGVLVERKGHYKLVIRIDLLQKGAACRSVHFRYRANIISLVGDLSQLYCWFALL